MKIKIEKIEERSKCEYCEFNAKWKVKIFFKGKWESMNLCGRCLKEMHGFAKSFEKAYKKARMRI